MIQFLPHTNFFDTYGFRSGKGRTPGQLSDYAYAPNDIVLTENAAEQLFHTKDAHGKRCISRDHGDTLYMPVVGTIGAMKMYSEWRPVPVAFMPMLTSIQVISLKVPISWYVSKRVSAWSVFCTISVLGW